MGEITAYGALADAVVLLHFLWIVFLFIGGIWGRRYRWVKRVHLAGLAFAFIVEVFDLYCPLTDLEVWFRRKGEVGGYTGSFITHYLDRLIYIELPRAVIVLSTVALCGLNLWLYLRPRRRRS